MQQPVHTRRPILIGTLALIAGAIATGAAFAGWANHGLDIFMTMAATGLSWCL